MENLTDIGLETLRLDPLKVVWSRVIEEPGVRSGGSRLGRAKCRVNTHHLMARQHCLRDSLFLSASSSSIGLVALVVLVVLVELVVLVVLVGLVVLGVLVAPVALEALS